MFRLLLVAALLGLTTNPLAAQPTDAAQSFVEYWNAGEARPQSNAELFTQAFMSRNGEDGLAELMGMLYSDNGAIAIHSISESGPEAVEFLVSSDNGNWMDVNLKLAKDGRIDGLGVNFAPPPPTRGDIGLSASQIADRLEAYLAELSGSGEFSGAVILAKDFEPLFARAYGLADRESQRENTLDTPINLGSMNKMFTGVAIGQLVADGKIDYQDTVGRHLPDYPNKRVRQEVTVHQLLTHTSGMGSYWNDLYQQSKNQLETQADFAELFVHHPLSFNPGEGEEYSNAGPVVLGLIIEAVTGRDYYDHIREKVYAPAGMTRSDHYDKYESISGKATGYFAPRGGSELVSNHEDLGRIGSAAGGGYASANDLLKFARALYDGTLLDEEQREVLTSFKVPWGDEGGYGYLFGDMRINGKRYIGHNGGAPGINAEFSHFPELGYTVIVLSNLDQAATPVADQIRTWIAYSE